MAGTLRVTVGAELTNGYAKDSFQPGQITVTQDAIGGVHSIVTIGTSEEAITTTDVSTLGWCFMRNLDTANYVEWGPESGGSMVAVGRMEFGEVVACRLKPGITLRAQANTAACKVEIWIAQD